MATKARTLASARSALRVGAACGVTSVLVYRVGAAWMYHTVRTGQTEDSIKAELSAKYKKPLADWISITH